jgi:hypothetical protein
LLGCLDQRLVRALVARGACVGEGRGSDLDVKRPKLPTCTSLVRCLRMFTCIFYFEPTKRVHARQHPHWPSIGLLSLLHVLPNFINPTTRLASEQLQFWLGQVNFICEKSILQTPGVWCVAFDDSDRTSTFNTHASLHRLARACVGI